METWWTPLTYEKKKNKPKIHITGRSRHRMRCPRPAEDTYGWAPPGRRRQGHSSWHQRE